MSNTPQKVSVFRLSFTNLFNSPLTAWVILAASLILTYAAYNISYNFINDRARERFDFRASEIQRAIQDRLNVYEQVLWSGVGLLYASDEIGRDGFAKFVNAVDIERNWPGIQGIGYSVPVTPEEKTAHIEAIRAEGFDDFVIKPEGARDMYSSIIYLEPFDWRNKRAFGYDMWSNQMRRAAMTRARDDGVAATSGIITLVQETEENVQRGFLTYVPVYKTNNIPQTIQERRYQFEGWIYAPYRAGDLMTGVLGSADVNIEFEVYDGEVIREDALLFDSNKSLHLTEINHNPKFSNKIKVINQGRLWTLYFNTPFNNLSKEERNQPRYIALAGLIVDILLFYVIWSLYFINKKAQNIARSMTQELHASKAGLENQVRERTVELQKARDNLEKDVKLRTEELHEKVNLLERANTAMVGREEKMIELKKDNERLKQELKHKR